MNMFILKYMNNLKNFLNTKNNDDRDVIDG